MVETPAALALYDQAKALAATHGYSLPKQYRGGGSDGNFSAALGIPTLDGLGCTGAGAHAPFEHICGPTSHPAARRCGLLETVEG